MSSVTLLDTDILSYLLRGHSGVLNRAEAYSRQHNRFHFSLMTRYEILRGLNARNATTQIVRFDDFCSEHHVLPITEEVISKAASIYARLYQRGVLINDADILIAATALVHGMKLATNNTGHFSRIDDLLLDNWAEEV